MSASVSAVHGLMAVIQFEIVILHDLSLLYLIEVDTVVTAVTISSSGGKFVALLMICGLRYIMVTHASPVHSIKNDISGGTSVHPFEVL